MIERPHYLNRLRRLANNGLVKVLTGMRRAGKSGILRLFAQDLMKQGTDPNDIVRVDLENIDQLQLREPHELLGYVRSRYQHAHTCYVMIDEAQEAEGIAEVAYTLLEDGCCDLYLTGSHARLVEQKLARALAGRFVEVPVFPLSFAEYHNAHTARGSSSSTANLFQRYLTHGGLPCSMAFEEDEYALYDYLGGVYHTVLRLDVAALLGKEDPLLLDGIIRQLMHGLGEPVSANGLSKTLSASGRSCSDDTVARYLDALGDSQAFYRVRRFDLRTHTLLKTQEKYYAADLGLRAPVLGTQGASLAGMLENVVYLELRRRYGEVHLGKHYTRTLSFVAMDAHGPAYFQVAPSVLDPQALNGALAPLRAEHDNYPKTLLTLDEVGTRSHEGILQHNIIDWLLNT